MKKMILFVACGLGLSTHAAITELPHNTSGWICIESYKKFTGKQESFPPIFGFRRIKEDGPIRQIVVVLNALGNIVVRIIPFQRKSPFCLPDFTRPSGDYLLAETIPYLERIFEPASPDLITFFSEQGLKDLFQEPLNRMFQKAPPPANQKP